MPISEKPSTLPILVTPPRRNRVMVFRRQDITRSKRKLLTVARANLDEVRDVFRCNLCPARYQVATRMVRRHS